MQLSTDLLSQFAKATKDRSVKRQETIVYGTIAESNGVKYVRLDGSDILTPMASTTNIEDGQRVPVMIKNHMAIVTGNLTSPAITNFDMDIAYSEINASFEAQAGLIASKVEQKDFNSLYEQVQSNSSEIIQTPDKISQEVINVKTTLQNSINSAKDELQGQIDDTNDALDSVEDNLQQQITENKASITTTATQIRSEVSSVQTTLQSNINTAKNNLQGQIDDNSSDIDAINKTVTEHSTAITQTAKDVTILANKTVGGRNYILNSKGPYTATGTGSTLKLWIWKCASIEEANSLYGKTVTISFDYKTAITSGMFNVLVNTTWQIVEAFDSNGKSGHISKTMSINPATATATTFLYIDGSWTGSVTFSNVKVEIGNSETDWSPHPEEFRAGSSVVINSEEVDITTPKFAVNILSDDGETNALIINEDGAVFKSAMAPNIAPRYDGPSTLYVNPNATSAQIAGGNYFRSLADAFSKLNKKWVGYNVAINLAAGMTEYGTVSLAGVSGGCWITIQGSSSNPAKIVGGLNLYYNTSPISVKYLKVDMTGNNGIAVEGCGNATISGCIITGTGSGYGIYSTNGACVTVDNSEIYDCDRSLFGIAGGVITGYACKGNCRVGANRTTLYLHDSMPCDSTTWTTSLWAGQVVTSNISVNQGSKGSVESAPTTAYYNFTHSDSYCTGWSYFSDNDVRQGYNGNRIYGVIWFDAAAIKSSLSGKTIKQASLRLTMHDGVGRGVSVSVHLRGTTTAYSTSLSGAPSLPQEYDYGSIGSTSPGETNEITIPTQVISDIVSSKIVGLVLYSDDTELYKDRTYSKNYARFDGSTSGDSNTRPRLTVNYS